jgi:phosphate-selective porin
MKLLLTKLVLLLFVFQAVSIQMAQAQFLMDMVDTTKDVGKGLLSIYKKYDHIKIGGYIQSQYQQVEAKGAKSFEGGDFATNVDNRFMLRRGRIRFDYVHFSNNTKPSVQFVFQFDGTERGVFIRDFWGRVFENNLKLFSLSTGMFARPFGYELNLSSSDRESPERGRMSQILMKTERDMGAMLSLEPRGRKNWMQYVKIDAGLFNGQGLAATADYDSYKDFIIRANAKPFHLNKSLLFSTGISYLNGGFIQNNKYVYNIASVNGVTGFTEDSTSSKVGTRLPRKYYGADAQLKWFHANNSATELRAEYWWGTQTANASSTETPAVLLTEPYYIRPFNGAFLYLLHSFDKHNQLGIKYDWYDPNTKLSAGEIGQANGSKAADIRYNTMGAGYIHYFDDNLKVVAWYNWVNNEHTQLSGYTNNVKDNVFTLRMQYRF